jgi:hypothetical protein
VAARVVGADDPDGRRARVAGLPWTPLHRSIGVLTAVRIEAVSSISTINTSFDPSAS